MSTFNGLDYVILGLLFLSVAIGITRGFVKEVISLIAWVAAFVISTLYSIKVAVLFSGGSDATGGNPIESVPMVSVVISYLVLFFGILICGSIIKWIVNSIVEGGGLGLVNRLLGAIFGFARGCVIILIALFFLAFTALTMHSLWKDSKMVAVFHPGVTWMNKMAQPYLAQIEAKMKKTAKSLNQEDLSDVIKVKPAGQPMPTPVTTPAKAPLSVPSLPDTTPQTIPEKK